MKVKLGKYIEEVSIKNKDDSPLPVYSVTNRDGFVSEYFSKEVASKDKTPYKRVSYGCFAYNPSRINVGSIAIQDKEDCVIVSPLYVVFKVSSELNKKYLFYYLKSDLTLSRIKDVATGSVRDNLKFSQLSNFEISVPSLDEQKKIVAFLDKVADLISLRKEQLKKLDQLVKSREDGVTKEVA